MKTHFYVFKTLCPECFTIYIPPGPTPSCSSSLTCKKMIAHARQGGYAIPVDSAGSQSYGTLKSLVSYINLRLNTLVNVTSSLFKNNQKHSGQ